MGFTLLAPLFLAGLAGLAIPILVHLTHKERKEVLPFPSLMFLERIPYPSTRRSRIRDLLLFALRCLALILIVAAFARPLVERKGAAPIIPLGGARELVVLLDRSYSMGYGDRWKRAKDLAREAIANIGPTDKATIVLFDAQAEAASPATSELGTLRAAIDGAEVGSGITRFVPALKLAEKIVIESELPKREIVLISDFQKFGWEAHEEMHLPAAVTLTTKNVGEGDTKNIAVTTAVLFRDLSGNREQLRASARITNTGAEPVTNVPVTLELNGRVLETKTTNVEPNGASSVTFGLQAIPTGLARGTIKAGKDDLAADNAFHFVLSSEHVVSVLILEHPTARETQHLFIETALEQGNQPEFRIAAKKIGALQESDLVGRAVVILNDVSIPSGAMGKHLRDYVQAGGGLIVLLGHNTSAQNWPSDAADLLPGRIGEVVDRSASLGGTLAHFQWGHPILEIFRAPRSGDFTTARFNSYRPMVVAQDSGVLMRFDDGAAALVERSEGAGRVLVFGSTLDLFWNDLATQAVFVPFVHQLVKYSATFSDAKTWFIVGDVLDLASQAQSLNRGLTVPVGASSGRSIPLTVEAPSGKTVRVAGTDTSRYLELNQQGFYSVKQSGGRGDRNTAVAANLNLKESDLSKMDPQEFALSIAPKEGWGQSKGGSDASLTVEERERRQTLWWYILIGAVLLLGAETLLSNRLTRVAR